MHAYVEVGGAHSIGLRIFYSVIGLFAIRNESAQFVLFGTGILVEEWKWSRYQNSYKMQTFKYNSSRFRVLCFNFHTIFREACTPPPLFSTTQFLEDPLVGHPGIVSTVVNMSKLAELRLGKIEVEVAKCEAELDRVRIRGGTQYEARHSKYTIADIVAAPSGAY